MVLAENEVFFVGWNGCKRDIVYGFQGQEMDDETGMVNYKYRMHNVKIGRFFAVDPLTAKYPHYTPYSFSGNKVVAHVELEGLEEAWYYSIITGRKATILNKEMVKGNVNYSGWHHHLMFEMQKGGSYQKTMERFDERVIQKQPFNKEFFDIYPVGYSVNFDYYSITIKGLPKDINPKEVFDVLKNGFINSINVDIETGGEAKTQLSGYTKRQEKKFVSDDMLGSIMTFEVDVLGFNADDLTVVATAQGDFSKGEYFWTFTPVWTLKDAFHPVSGHRTFGLIQNSDGDWMFYTQGMDRPTTFIDKFSTTKIFEGAHKNWTNLMKNSAKLIEDKYGKKGVSAEVTHKFKKVIDYDKISEEDKKPIWSEE